MSVVGTYVGNTSAGSSRERLVHDAITLSESWRSTMDLNSLVATKLQSTEQNGSRVDVVAVGKAAREMAEAVDHCLGSRVNRRFIVCTEESARRSPHDRDIRFGEHPVPSTASIAAGLELVSFLEASDLGDTTLFLVSGGASSLCALPMEPLNLSDLVELWNVVVSVGADITTYNKVRAATSRIAGGAVLRHVRTERSRSLIMVDNVGGGAPWVGSSLTYDYVPQPQEVATLVTSLELNSTALGTKLEEAARRRVESLMGTIGPPHDNIVLADSGLLLRHVTLHARRAGYEVVDMGAHVEGDVTSVANDWSQRLGLLRDFNGRLCVVGTGEVTVRVKGSGRGGRCQEFAWRMANELRAIERDIVFAAASSDGRDHLPGVSGAWSSNETVEKARHSGIDWRRIADDHDSHRALDALDQLIPGTHTGWNLCDVYLAVL